MSQHDQWQAHPSYRSMSGKHDSSNRAEGDSSTFVNPVPVGSSQSYFPYGCPMETVMPPPPPGIDAPVVPHSKRNTGYLIALVVLSGLVVALGSLELLQVMTLSGHSRSLRTCWIASCKHHTNPARGRIREDTDSWHDQRERDADLQRL